MGMEQGRRLSEADHGNGKCEQVLFDLISNNNHHHLYFYQETQEIQDCDKNTAEVLIRKPTI